MSEIKIQLKTENGIEISKEISPAVLTITTHPYAKNAFIIGEFDENSSDNIGENFVSIYLDDKDLEKLRGESE